MLRCSPEAYARCPDRQYCGPLEDAVFVEASECDCFNIFVELVPDVPARFFCYEQIEKEWNNFLRLMGVNV